MYGSGGVMNGVSCGEVSHERIGNLAGPVDVLIGEVGECLVLGVLPSSVNPLMAVSSSCVPTPQQVTLVLYHYTRRIWPISPERQSSTYTFS